MSPRNLQAFANDFKDYTEIRLQENRDQTIVLLNGDLMNNHQDVRTGVSARVYHQGAWGFASAASQESAQITAVMAAAQKNAQFLASHRSQKKRPLPETKITGEHTYFTARPRRTQKEVIDFLRRLDEHVAKKPALISRQVILKNLDMEKQLLTAHGSHSHSMTPRASIYVGLTMLDKDQKPVQLMHTFSQRGQFEDVFTAPESLFEQIDDQYEHLRKKAEGVLPEAGIRQCVLAPDLAGILAHEAIGHTTEADLVLGGSVAGDYLGQAVASPLVTLVDFAHTAFGETCPVPVHIDDEGTQAEDAVIIEQGILKTFMHNKESALHFDARPTGNARAFQFSDEPLIRMRNTAILPGQSRLDDMISSVEDGYYLMRPGNGQADSTSEFMFAVTQGYEIKNGKLGRALKNTTISGVAFDLLKTVDMVSDDMVWECSGFCGKKQLMPVGMGGPAIRCHVAIGGQ